MAYVFVFLRLAANLFGEVARCICRILSAVALVRACSAGGVAQGSYVLREMFVCFAGSAVVW